jgi:galactokinase
MTNPEREIRSKFISLYGKEPLIVRSPGRINLIGEHTDYNDGFVMPAAIDKEILFAIAPSDNHASTIFALKYNEQFSPDIYKPEKVKHPRWANYLLGVLFQFKAQGYQVKPFNCVFGGDVPLGAGLSSSAALECGFGFALSEIFNLEVPKINIVKTAQWAEHNFADVKCGIMDQFASVMSKAGHVILLDCRSLEYRYLPFDLKEHTILLCDTKVKHALVDSEYNTRRNECEKGVSVLQKYFDHVKSLRDVTYDMLLKHQYEFPGKVYNRCLYVVQEIQRVQEAAHALENYDIETFGKKMYETHKGLSALYEVSCAELDFLVEEAQKFPEILGARMMGGGFGGCTINIVKKDFVSEFEAHLKSSFKKEFATDMPVYRVNVQDGTSVVTSADISIS